MKFMILFMAVTLLGTVSVSAKCGNSSIVVTGKIKGPTLGTAVAIKVSPDPNWEPQPEVSIGADGSFRSTTYFDRTRSEGRTRDDCSRGPEEVTVELRIDGRAIDSVTLVVKRDFVTKGRHQLENKYPVELRSK